MEHVFRAGGVVLGQLHHEGGGIAGKHFGLFQDDTRNNDGGHADKVGGHGHQAAAVEERSGEEGDNGHLRAAGDKAGGHDGHAAVALIFNGTGGHDAGDAAARADQHRDEALARKAELPEDPVHDESDAGHVAHILQDGQHQKQYQHLRHEAEDRTHAGDDTVGNKAREPLGHAPALQQGPRPGLEPLRAQNVVGPVGEKAAEGSHGDPVDQEHDAGKDGQRQNAVGDNLVDFVGNGQAVLGGLFPHRLGDDGVDIRVALVGDDALGVVIQLLFAVRDMFLQVGPKLRVQPEILQHLVVPLKQLDGEPAQVARVHLALNRLLDVRDGVLDAAGKHMGQFRVLSGLGQRNRLFSDLHAALALERAHLQHLAAQFLTQRREVDFVAVFAHQVDHVDRDHHRDSQLHQLSGEIEVPLDVGAVHDVDDGVGLFGDQIASGDHLLQRVGGKGVDAGQILNDHILMALEAALLLLHRDARPVAHILVGTGQVVEQGRLAAVGIACQRNFDVHAFAPLEC